MEKKNNNISNNTKLSMNNNIKNDKLTIRHKMTGLENLYKPSKISSNKISTDLSLINKTLLIDTSIKGLTRLSKIYNDNNQYKLITMIEEWENEENIQSNIYYGKVIKIDKTNNSIFLNYDHNKICFLNMKELIKQNFTEKAINSIAINDYFIIQMIRERNKHKHPKVTTNIMMYGLYCNILVDSSFDVIYHNQSLIDQKLYISLSQHKNLKNIKIFIKQPPQTINQKLLMDDIKYMIRTWKHIKLISSNRDMVGLLHFEPHIQKMIRFIIDNRVNNIIVDNEELLERLKSMPFLFNKQQIKTMDYLNKNIFKHYKIHDEIDKLHQLHINKDSITIIFQKTEALITVDVDYSSKNKNLKNLWEINHKAAQIIVEEIIKKNIGGSILIDFINMYMTNEYHNEFIQFIKDRFQDHGVNCAIYNVKQLGFVFFCLPYNKYDIFNRVYDKCNDCDQGFILKPIYNFYHQINFLEKFLEDPKPFHKKTMYIDNNHLYLNIELYNFLIKNEPSLIINLINKNILPIVNNSLKNL